jgi:hypothetical protein
MLFLPPLQLLDSQLGQLSFIFKKVLLAKLMHCNITAMGYRSVTLTVDLLPTAQRALFKAHRYFYVPLPTEGPPLSLSPPEGYEPEPSHCLSRWGWSEKAAKAGGEACE